MVAESWFKGKDVFLSDKQENTLDTWEGVKSDGDWVKLKHRNASNYQKCRFFLQMWDDFSKNPVLQNKKQSTPIYLNPRQLTQC